MDVEHRVYQLSNFTLYTEEYQNRLLSQSAKPLNDYEEKYLELRIAHWETLYETIIDNNWPNYFKISVLVDFRMVRRTLDSVQNNHYFCREDNNVVAFMNYWDMVLKGELHIHIYPEPPRCRG